jgi:hypothetical protein
VRELPLYLNPQAEHLLDWFHVAMRLTGQNLGHPVDPATMGARNRIADCNCRRTIRDPVCNSIKLIGRGTGPVGSRP